MEGKRVKKGWKPKSDNVEERERETDNRGLTREGMEQEKWKE